jgi:DNA-binding IscR family transcriptional regulator
VIRAIDGPLANVAGTRPDALDLTGSAAPLRDVWVSLRSSIREVLEHVTVADVVSGKLPDKVLDRTRDRDAWTPH